VHSRAPDVSDCPLQPLRRQKVIVVKKEQKVAGRVCESSVAGGTRAQIPRVTDDLYLESVKARDRHGRGRTVVNDDAFDVRVRLGSNGRQGGLEMLRAPIGRDDDGDTRFMTYDLFGVPGSQLHLHSWLGIAPSCRG
jgi:hypothetical protein